MKRNYFYLALILIFLIFSFVYPIFQIIFQCFYHNGRFTFDILKIAIDNYVIRKSILNSFLLGIIVVLTTSIIGIPLAFVFDRFKFKGKPVLKILYLLPMISSPFVGGIGIKQVLSRFGSLKYFIDKTWNYKKSNFFYWFWLSWYSYTSDTPSLPNYVFKYFFLSK
jgi:iron(III) transport system permease protein